MNAIGTLAEIAVQLKLAPKSLQNFVAKHRAEFPAPVEDRGRGLYRIEEVIDAYWRLKVASKQHQIADHTQRKTATVVRPAASAGESRLADALRGRLESVERMLAELRVRAEKLELENNALRGQAADAAALRKQLDSANRDYKALEIEVRQTEHLKQQLAARDEKLADRTAQLAAVESSQRAFQQQVLELQRDAMLAVERESALQADLQALRQQLAARDREIVLLTHDVAAWKQSAHIYDLEQKSANFEQKFAATAERNCQGSLGGFLATLINLAFTPSDQPSTNSG